MEKQLTYEQVDLALIEDNNSSIKGKIASNITSHSPWDWEKRDMRCIALNDLCNNIEEIERSRAVMAELYGKSHKLFDVEAYLNQYEELSKFGRKKVIQECNLGIDSSGCYDYEAYSKKYEEIQGVAESVAKGLESHFEEN